MPSETGFKLNGVLMRVTVLAGVGGVVHGGQQVGNFSSLRWSDVLCHVDDAIHRYVWIRLHETVNQQIQFILRDTNQRKLLHLVLTLSHCTLLIMR